MSENLHSAAKGNDSTPSNLPVLLRPAALLLRRVQKALGLTNDVVQESSAEYWYERGKQASEAQEWAGAVYAFAQCVKLNSSHWRGHLQFAAAITHQQKNPAQALIEAYNHSPYTSFEKFKPELTDVQWREINDSINISAKDKAWSNLMGVAILHMLSRNEDELNELLEVLYFDYADESRGSYSFLRLLGWHNNYIDYKGSALEFYTEAIELDPKRPECYFYRSGIRYGTKDYSGALSDVNRAIELDAKEAALFTNRAALKTAFKDTQGALQDLDKAIELNPNLALAFLNRGRLKYDQQSYDAALTDFNYAANIYTKNIEVFFRRGLCKEALNDFSGALADYDFAASLDSTSPDLFNQRAELREKLGDWKGADSDRYLARTFTMLRS